MYTQDRQWANSYDRQIIEILGKLPAAHFIDVANASVERDNHYATDFVLRLIGGDIAVRLRRSDCGFRDLTIRARRDSGTKTELAKIKEGYAYRYFYGWTDEDKNIAEWILVDLDRLRATNLLERPLIPNYDGTYFIAISIEELLAAGCLIASQPERAISLIPPFSKPATQPRRDNSFGDDPFNENLPEWDDEESSKDEELPNWDAA